MALGPAGERSGSRSNDMPITPDFRAMALEFGLDDRFPEDVLSEVRNYQANPGIDDVALVDLTALPFVTIDGAGTRDLDQALHLAAESGGIRLHYAIADASYYVAPGTALFREALRRGSSFYLPRYSVPMLPRALSEGLVSLAPDANRRALVFDVRLDERATVTSFTIVRARVRSRARLTFDQVDGLFSNPADSPLAAHEAANSLALFNRLGSLLADHEERTQVVRYQRTEAGVRLARDGSVAVYRSSRGLADLANEQLSILCNGLGARWFAGAQTDFVEPIYRVHPTPGPERLQSFEKLVRQIVLRRALPAEPWLYECDGGLDLAAYLERLPTDGPGKRLAQALHRQAMVLNGRSSFTSAPAGHFGVGEAVYSRFTSPMREVVGIFCHKEAFERLAGRGAQPREVDEAVRAQVIDAANRAKDLQRRLGREVGRAMSRVVLGADAAHPVQRRPRRRGTVMGISSSVVYVQLDDPPIDVVAPLRDEPSGSGDVRFEVVDDGGRLRGRDSLETICSLGDEVVVYAASDSGVVLVSAEAASPLS